MAKGINKVILIGNIGKDPETRSFPDGGSITNASIATTETWKNRQTGNQESSTEWHRVVFKNRLAEIAAQYLSKGSKVYVEGSLKTRKWTNQQGQDQYSTEVHVRELQMLDSRSEPSGQNNGGFSQPANPERSQTFGSSQQQSHQDHRAHSGSNQQNPTYEPSSNNNFEDFDDDIPF